MNILILEDHFPLQQELVHRIERLGHAAFGVSNATDATELLKTTHIDALVTDIFVKEDDRFVPDGGILLISRVRTNVGGKLNISKDAPILAITAATSHFNETAPLNASNRFGADLCLRKPLDMTLVVQWINEISTTI